ncbi:hypothetical protein I8748_32240 [Nostoc sp. CENA67]|uniref:Uncharacterized protein n=1 Tax=Amazonocrinis nigriterrae CENA67 TaxID=2794033 RepID=A0A8J7LCG5_9NOST|nr:hypothetical protein [Amazonocrinis nigriterrae]MBH8566770.1 hypothetical protein [Amazonocrinis nigriterrae CENA67]
MKSFYTPADAILNLDNEEALIADQACCEDWFSAVGEVARQHQMSYLSTRKILVAAYQAQRVLSLYGICKAFYLAESAR